MLATPSVERRRAQGRRSLLEGHGSGRDAGARADDADGGGERHRLAEDRRGGRCRHDDLGGVVARRVTVIGVVVWVPAMPLAVTVSV